SGDAAPVEPSGPWATSAPTLTLETWLDILGSAGGYERVKTLKKALERPDFTDLRLLDPLLRALGTTHHGLGRLAAEKALPAFGPAVLPEVERRFDLPKGKAADARRLVAICAIDAKRGAALCRQALTEGSSPVKVQALRSLSRLAPEETEQAALTL